MHRRSVILFFQFTLLFTPYHGPHAIPVHHAETPPPTIEIQTTENTDSTNLSRVLTSSPLANGIIVHMVDSGQTLYTIAIAYGVTVDQIKSINNLTSDEIFVGDRLIIRLGNTPTVTKPVTQTPARTLRPTRTTFPPLPTRTPSRTPSPLYTTEAVITPLPSASQSSGIDPLLLVIGGMAVSGVLLMIIGTLLKKRM